MESSVLELPELRLQLESVERVSGHEVLRSLLHLAERAIGLLQAESIRRGKPLAAVGKLRGTGRGVHFKGFIDRLEADHPIHLVAPFEDSPKVSGAAWNVASGDGTARRSALAKLRWEAGADDLPMHVHEHSDRFIIVHEGRGYFHVSDQLANDFDGSDVRSIPARERDVFMFTRACVHTFSTAEHPMTLLSCQLPFLEFDDPRQYRLPAQRWTARDRPEPHPASVSLTAAWSILSGLGLELKQAAAQSQSKLNT